MFVFGANKKQHFVSSSISGPKNEHQEAVVGAFKHAWAAYKKYAWEKTNCGRSVKLTTSGLASVSP